MNTNPDLKNSATLVGNSVKFIDIFNLEDIQRLQDLFSDANGVASIITHPDGSPITNPSNFCRLCNDIIRKTKKGFANPAFTSLYGFSSDENVGKTTPRIIKSGVFKW